MAKNTNRYLLVNDAEHNKCSCYETIDDLKEDIQEGDETIYVMTDKQYNTYSQKTHDNGREDGVLTGYFWSIAGAFVANCARIIIRSIRKRNKK